jgi:hypothetical protein
MKKGTGLFLFLVLFLSAPAFAVMPKIEGKITGETRPMTRTKTKSEPGPVLSVTAGLRTDNFDWNISDSDGSPNVLSELTWDKLRIYQIKAATRIVMNGPFYMRGHFGYGWIWDGSNQDSDYNGDNRTLEFSRSNNLSDSGEVWDASAAVGYTIDAGALEVSPLLGYSYHAQYLKITDGFQTICDAGGSPQSCSVGLGPFAGLNSNYDALWYGPWVGVDLRYKTPNRKLTLYGTFELHLVLYRAEANWNLRSAFQHPVSFEHTGDGQGVLVSLGADYKLKGPWSLVANLDADAWRVKDGLDRTFLSSGGSNITSTPLNEVHWDSVAFMSGLKYSY